MVRRTTLPLLGSNRKIGTSPRRGNPGCRDQHRDQPAHASRSRVALRELHRVLKPGSHLLLTVPTFGLLWGLQDEVSHHKRRYRLHDLLPKLLEADFSLKEYFYFNYLLFLPILAGRSLVHILRIAVASEAEINTRWLNRLLTLTFRLDVKTAPWLRPPFGVSALVVAIRK